MPEITHTSATQIAPGVRRITARNPGKMTGPGTNTYVVGESEVAIIDPGPLLDEHIDSIERIFGDKIKKILVTIPTAITLQPPAPWLSAPAPN